MQDPASVATDRETSAAGAPLAWLLAAIALFLTAGVLLLGVDQYPAIDLLAYVSTARRYANGDLASAINGCWGPLGSWVVVPLLLAGVEPLLAYRLVALALGVLTLVGIRRLALRIEMSVRLRGLVLLLAAPWVLAFGYVPDLLLVCVLVHYLALVADPEFGARRGAAVACGALGGLAYYSKAYGLPLFAAHYTLACAWHAVRGRRDVLRSYALGMLVFALLAGAWVGAISTKYGFTLGTVSGYTHAVLGPDARDHPIFVDGFFEPADERALSVWDDPSRIEVPRWNPLASRRNLLHQARLVARNGWRLVQTYVDFSLLSFAILLGYGLLCLPLRRGLRSPAALPLGTVLLVPTGYLFVQVWHYWPGRGRYVWINAILLLLMGGHLVHLLLRRASFDRSRRTLLLVAFAATFLTYPIRNLRQVHGWNAEYAPLAAELATLELDGATASNTEFHVAQYLSWRMGCQYYGSQRVGASDEEVARELERHGIDWFLYWRDPERPAEPLPVFLQGRPDLTAGRYPRLSVFALGEVDRGGT